MAKICNEAYVVDFIEPRVTELLEEGSKRYGRTLSVEAHRRVAEEVLLGCLSLDWRTVLKRITPILTDRKRKASIDIRPYRYSRDNGDIQVNYLYGGVKDRERRLEGIKQSGVTGMAVAQFRHAVEKWPDMSIRTHREQVLIDGEFYERWLQEFAVIGEAVRWSTVEPKIAWRLRISAIFPKRKEGMPTDFLPELRLEVIEEAILTSVPGAGDALIGTLQALALEVANNLVYKIKEEDQYDFLSEGARKLPLKLMFVLLPHHQQQADALVKQFHNEDGGEFFGDETEWLVNGIELLRIEARTTPIATQPVIRPKNPERAALPKPQEPGETFQLLEFALTSVVLCTDGKVRSSHILKMADDFRDEVGVWPIEFLREIEFDIASLGKIEHFKEAEAFIGDAAEAYGVEFETIRIAIQLGNQGKSSHKQPVLRVLFDLATGVHEIEWDSSSSSISSFLDRATSTGRFLGVRSKRLRVAKKLLSAESSIGAWADRYGVCIEHPKSGFDGGATQARLWNDAAISVFHALKGSPWWQTSGRTIDAATFVAALGEASAQLNGFEPQENNGLIGRVYLPASLYVNNADPKLRAWRDRHVEINEK
ncbi:MAG: hypothetical protein KJZ90_00970 [Rhodocyclaceae bacterium]|nr:hypothetical protein [Rhodocyclaceae bacterium]